MAVTSQPFHGLVSLQVWWPDHAADVVSLLNAAPVISVLHCRHAVAEALRPYAFSHYPHQNLMIDLMLSEEELWLKIHRRDRFDIRKAAQLDFRVLINEETERALTLINGVIERRRFSRPLRLVEWQRLREKCDVFLAECRGVAIASRVVLVDAPRRRVRGLFGATVDRDDPRYRGLVGSLNRALFWHEFLRYKALGMRWYDMGGVDFNRASPIFSISQFKASFGGTVVTEHTLRLTRQPFVRLLFRAAASAQRFGRRTQAANL
jgi:hypothetical protein